MRRREVIGFPARHALPREVVDNVAARTGGVPLFVEKVTRLLLEQGDKDGIHVIPPSLQQSLQQRGSTDLARPERSHRSAR